MALMSSFLQGGECLHGSNELLILQGGEVFMALMSSYLQGAEVFMALMRFFLQGGEVFMGAPTCSVGRSTWL